MRYYVGIDMGTSSVKVLLMDESGCVVKDSSRGYAVSEPRPGWKEIDPEFWMKAASEGYRIERCDRTDAYGCHAG